MIKTLTNVLKQDKEKFAVPKNVQDIIRSLSQFSWKPKGGLSSLGSVFMIFALMISAAHRVPLFM